MFSHLIVITPLGFLYGSSGPFLSPENLVGKSGNNFPPSSATVSGLYAAKYSQPIQESQKLNLPDLIIAGPFWAQTEEVQNFYVPTPFNCLVKLENSVKDNSVAIKGEIKTVLKWHQEEEQWLPFESGKFDSQTWIPIQQWSNLQKGSEVTSTPWKYTPHLHPQLEINERKVRIVEDENNQKRGYLFLENAVQMHPETCLVYLTNTPIDPGWYRFGGESHLVELECLEIQDSTKQLFAKPIEQNLALITPAIWGSNRFSYRLPMVKDDSTNQEDDWRIAPEWEKAQMITERSNPFRYRLGGNQTTKRLSRGRYAVPAGTVYTLENPLSQSWLDWDESWFPQEGYSLRRWGCGLALPLD